MSAVLRCDRCGVRAKAEILLPSGLVFALCGHHFAEQRKKGLPRGTTVASIRQEEVA